MKVYIYLYTCIYACIHNMDYEGSYYTTCSDLLSRVSDGTAQQNQVSLYLEDRILKGFRFHNFSA